MRYPVRSFLLAAVVPFALAACAGDLARPVTDGPQSGAGDVAATEHSVQVRTRFVVTDLDQLPEDIDLSRLTVNVGAIFLEPIGGSERNVSFANRTPVSLDFALADGDFSLPGPALELPWGGEFAVSVQVEPPNTELDDDKAASGTSSVAVAGMWTQHHVVTDLVSDEPSPLPWREKSRLLDPIEIASAVEFEFRSQSVVRIQLAEVALADSGDYELTLSIRLADWVRESVMPALQVEADRRLDPVRAFDTVPMLDVDVDNSVEADAYGIEGLVGDIDVHASRR
jgi:hypothetical protein